MYARRLVSRSPRLLFACLLICAGHLPAQPQSISGQHKTPGPIPMRPRSLYVPPAPQLDPVDPTPTAATSIAISGSAPGAAELLVQAPSGSQTLPLSGASFALDVPLLTDQVNTIFVFSRSFSGIESSPTKAVVVQDSSPPP